MAYLWVTRNPWAVLMDERPKESGRCALRVREVARRLDMSYDTVMRLVHAGKIKAFNVTLKEDPKRPEYRVTEDALDAFIQGRTVVIAVAPDENGKPRRRRRHVEVARDFFPGL